VMPGRRKIIGLLVVFLLAGAHARPASAPAPPRQGYVQPFTYDPLTEPFIVIPVTINGQTLPFILDTGTTWPLLIDSRTAAKLHLHPTGKASSFSDSHKTAFQTVLRSMRLFGSTGYNFPFALITDLHALDGAYAGPRIAGIIGVSLLSKAVVQLDLPTRRMVLSFRHHPVRPAPGASVLPMQRLSNGLYRIVITPQPGSAVSVMLDTGATGTSLPQDLIRRLTASGNVPATSFSFAGEHNNMMMLLPQVRIGRFSEPNVVVGAWTSEKAGLGLDLLFRFRVTLDFPHRMLILERPADYSKRVRVPGWAGLLLEPREGSWVVDLALEVSGAPAAGVHKGDRVLSIDGRSLKNMPPLVVEHLLDGWAGSRAVLAVEHPDGKKAQVSFTRISQFAPAVQKFVSMMQARSVKDDGSFAFNDLGFTLGPGKGSLVVTNVADGSVAGKAGVQKGDKIVSLNDFPLDKITQMEMASVTNSPEVDMKVLRAGEDKPREFHVRAK